MIDDHTSGHLRNFVFDFRSELLKFECVHELKRIVCNMLFCVLLLDVLHETRKHLDEYGYRMFMKKCFSNMANVEHEMELNGEIIASCIHKSLVTSTCFPKYIIGSNNFDRETNNLYSNWIN